MKKAKDIKTKEKRFVLITLAVSLVLLSCAFVYILTEVYISEDEIIARIEGRLDDGDYESALFLMDKYKERLLADTMENYKTECSYLEAKEAFGLGSIQKARSIFKELGDYSDSPEMIVECDYINACDMFDSEDYTEAKAAFLALAGYKDGDEKVLECKYYIAENTYLEGNTVDAFYLFQALGKFMDAPSRMDTLALEITGRKSISEAYEVMEDMDAQQIEKYAELTEARATMPSDVLAVGMEHTVGLNADGTVVSVGSDEYGQCDTAGWTDITAVAAGAHHTLGLNAGGTVVAAGSDEYGQCEVDDWKNVIQITAGAYDSYALCSDGKILSTGFNGKSSLAKLEDVKFLAAGSYGVAAMLKEGDIVSAFPSLMGDAVPGAVSLCVSTAYWTALTVDGNIISPLTALEGWENIVSVSAGSTAILGVASDGTVAAHFFKERDAFPAEDIHDAVAAAAGGSHHAVLLEGGSVLAFGDNTCCQCDVSEWLLKYESDSVP